MLVTEGTAGTNNNNNNNNTPKSLPLWSWHFCGGADKRKKIHNGSDGDKCYGKKENNKAGKNDLGVLPVGVGGCHLI